jgi:DNA ligase-1
MKYSILCEVYEKLESTSSRLEKTEILSGFFKKLKKDDKEIIYLLQGRIFPDYDEREMGISDKLVVKALSRATGNSPKDIEKHWKKLGDLGLVAEQITEKKKQSTLSRSDISTEKVLKNLQKLPDLEGKGTVDKKMGLIAELLTSSTPKEAKYLVRLLLGDLRIGTGAGTIRDSIVWSCFDKEDKEAYDLVQDAFDKATDWKLVFEASCKGKKELEKTELIPGQAVKVMLYPKVSNVEEAFERAGKPAAFEFKYDGFRIMASKKGDEVKLFTRRLDNVSKQFPDVVKYIKQNIKADSFIVDAEAVGYDPKTKEYRPFQEISQRIKRKYDIEKLEKELPVEVIIFDIIYYEGRSYIKKPFKERRKLLKKIVKQQKNKTVLAEQIITDKESDAQKFFDKAIGEGQEGLMVKKLEAPYKPGSRIGYGYKLKPEDKDFDLVITEAEYGTGKRAGWLTSYSVSCSSEDGFLEVGKVSTGLKEKDEEGLSFNQMTQLLKPLITKEHGRRVEVKPKVVVSVTYQNIQKSPTYTSGYALRFPRITRLRPDRSVMDIATKKEIEKEYEK